MVWRKIVSFLRESVLIFSIILTIIGAFTFIMGIVWFFLKDDVMSGELSLGFFTDLLNKVGEWNFYLLFVGFILLITGVWYLFSYFKNKKFVLKELETKKRSELLKKHAELKNTVKHMPTKYQKMVKDKEKELKIK